MTQKKDDGMVRILFQNVGGLGFLSGDVHQESVKVEKLKKMIINKSIDIVGLAEVNKDWRCVNTETQYGKQRKAGGNTAGCRLPTILPFLFNQKDR